jgi:hypothetical protein
MSESDAAYLVCLPVKGGGSLIIPGSTKTRCGDCGERVWISPASLRLSKKRHLKIVCMPCADVRAEKDDNLQIQPPTEEQRQEIRDMIERG